MPTIPTLTQAEHCPLRRQASPEACGRHECAVTAYHRDPTRYPQQGARPMPTELAEVRCWNNVPDYEDRSRHRFGFTVGTGPGEQVWTGAGISDAELFAALRDAGLIARDAELEASAARRPRKEEP
jgi:hypothetical protein